MWVLVFICQCRRAQTKLIKTPEEAAVSQNGSNLDRAADLTWLSNWNKMGLLVVVVEISNKVYRQTF